MTVHVREVQAGELEPVGELTVQAYLSDDLIPPEHEYVVELRDAARRAAEVVVLVAVEEGVVVGTVTIAPAGSPYAEVALPGEAEIRMLAVDPRARG